MDGSGLYPVMKEVDENGNKKWGGNKKLGQEIKRGGDDFPLLVGAQNLILKSPSLSNIFVDTDKRRR
jgi:hypothetical protein